MQNSAPPNPLASSFQKSCFKWRLKDNSSLLNLGCGKSPKWEYSMGNCASKVNTCRKCLTLWMHSSLSHPLSFCLDIQCIIEQGRHYLRQWKVLYDHIFNRKLFHIWIISQTSLSQSHSSPCIRQLSENAYLLHMQGRFLIILSSLVFKKVGYTT